MAEGGSEPVNYQGVVECDICEETNDVNNYCINCQGNICDKCKHVHCNTRLFKKHKVLPRTQSEVQRARKQRKVYCQKHHDVEYVNFCIKCQVPCCSRCIASEHSGHDFSELFDEISKVEKELIKMAVDLESSKIPEAKRTVDKIDRAILEYEERGDKTKKSIKDTIEEIHNEVDKIGEDVLTALEVQRGKDIQKMQFNKKKISDNLAEMARQAETCRSAPADASLLHLKEKFRNIESTPMYTVQLPANIVFEKSTSKLPSSADLIGKITTGEIINIDVPRKSDNVCRLVSFNIRMMEERIVESLERKRGDTILHTMNGETWILNVAAETISVFDDRCNQIREINLGFLCRDMALTQTEVVIATDYSNDRIVMISTSGSTTDLRSTAPLIPWGMCVNNKQQIVVGVIEGGHSKLVVYSSDGSSVQQEIEYDQSGKRLFTGWIYRVRQTVSGDYVLAANGSVICLSPEWNVKWRYEVGYYNSVYGLCCDKYNNIVFADRDKNEIIMLSIEGELIKTLFTNINGINEPYALSVDKSELMWIGQKENTLVFQYMKP